MTKDMVLTPECFVGIKLRCVFICISVPRRRSELMLMHLVRVLS